MKKELLDKRNRENVAIVQHFAERSSQYDTSGSWVTDPSIQEVHLNFLSGIEASFHLDVATGTGIIARWFRETISKNVVGIDIAVSMLHAAKNHGIDVAIANIEKLPFRNHSFDLVSCRQGLHYPHINNAVSEIVRVANRHILISQIICASEEDLNWWAKIFKIKQPLRKNIFTEERLLHLFAPYKLVKKNARIYFEEVKLSNWFKYGVSSQEAFHQVYELFEGSSVSIKQLNQIKKVDGDFIYSNRWYLVLFECM